MTDFNRVIRYLAYTLELLVLFMLQETPGLMPAIFGSRPLMVLPAAVTIALFEPELTAMAFGVLGGLFLDFGFSCPMGFHALILAVLCFFVSTIVKVYLQVNFVTAMITGLWTTAVVVASIWLFLYYFPGYSMPGYAVLHRYLPEYFYTLLFFPLTFLLNKALYQALKQQE